MDARCSNSFAANARLLVKAVLAGMAELALCRDWRAGLLIIAGFLPFSPEACGMALLGASVATAWPFVRQSDVRLLNSGWYGANGALCGFLVEWYFADPLGAVILTVLSAWAAALILEAIVIPLGDAPLAMAPLTIPFLVMAALITVSVRPLYKVMESLAVSEPAAAVSGPEGADDWSRLGWGQFQRGEVGPSVRSFNAALTLDPAHPWALDGLGWAVYSQGRYGEAEGLFARAQAAMPGLADPLTGLGWIGLRQGRFEAAYRHFSEALARDGGSAVAGEGLGRALLASGRHRDAEMVFLGLLGSSPAALRGLADSRRMLLLNGAALTPDSREWAELIRLLGWKVAALGGLALTVLIWTPVAGMIGLSLMALGAMTGVLLAGPSSLLWFDLHLQTVAMTGLLMARPQHFRGLWSLIAVLGLAVAVWAVSHRLGIWLPLLSFNLAGMAGLLLLRRSGAGLGPIHIFSKFN
ncbi:hypothetical protein CCC_02960 [Paramagnetospirillum magnetotacticum MS-1]|uniref:Uncharacterized protein n=1 Tax=Paramagnetospirillum magnetotacticum MS-1 TaxID=272627 RepID=A0A0C2V540_PARME|nr:urea transporter [Paramagnetospirillum magnetotacticum]KIM00172.1 hypothetical protein CCC_02960 [Paramagnetospirillum magnetotacticum MS-1]